MIGDASEDVAHPRFGIDVVELCGFDERVDGGGTFAALVGAGEEIVLAAERERPDGTFGGVVVDLEPAVVDEARQRKPARERIADGFCQIGFLREFRARRGEPFFERVEQRPGFLLPHSSPFVGRLAARLGFDGVI